MCESILDCGEINQIQLCFNTLITIINIHNKTITLYFLKYMNIILGNLLTVH